MLAKIKNEIQEISCLELPCRDLTVGFISEQEFLQIAAHMHLSLPLHGDQNTLMSNAVHISEEAIWCVLSLVNPGQILGERDRIGLLMMKNCFLVIDLYDQDDSTGQAVQRVLSSLRPEKATLPRLICGFFREILIRDPGIHEELEMRIDELEKQVFDRKAPQFRHTALVLGKELLTLNRYYEQLIEINDHLEENVNDLFDSGEVQAFALMNDRILRYRGNIQMLREILTQTQQSYQAQLDYQLNKTMKTLSMVTTICLPLSLIAGWYGMNFAAMPELKWEYGYLYVILLSLSVITLVITLLKRKKG